MAVYRDRRVPIPDITGITINRGDNNRVLYVLSAPYDNKVGYTLNLFQFYPLEGVAG